MAKNLGFNLGGEIHEMMIDLIEMVFGTMNIETIRDFKEGKFIYDIYIPEYDIPIEIGSNKERKLNYLFENKKQFFLVPLGSKKSFTSDWLIRGKKGQSFKYYLVYEQKRLKIISISKYKLPGHKIATDWLDF